MRMASEKTLMAVIAKIEGDVNGVIATAAVDLESGMTLEDMLLTLTDQFHLIKLLPGGGSFLYLAADKSTTNLAILRTAVNKHCAQLAA
jgi:hypothetical protein